MILLRTHSRFSFHRATASIKELVNAAAEAGMSHLALTDYYGLFGAVRFAERCKKYGVKPIVGMMTRVQLPHSGRPDHLTLLAQNNRGYQSLCELSTIHQTEKETQQDGVSWERFTQSAAGLICIVGGHGSVLGDEVTQEELRPFSQLFGDDSYFALNQQSSEGWIAIGEAAGLDPVWCQPVYHVNPADVDMFRVLQAIDQNIRLEEVDPTTLPKNVGWPPFSDQYEVTSDQYGKRGTDYWKLATDNTYAIAEKCEDCLPDGRPLWPVLKLPEGKSAARLLEEKCQLKLKKLYEDVTPHIEKRLAAELQLITQHNFEPLFLILAEVIEFVRENRILMGSRGSVANSLVAYCLGISLVDPIKYDLLFERFLNPERKSLPDIDLDFESRNGRDAVLGFIRERYGEHRVALVSTINTYRKRSAVRETAKAYGMSSTEISRMSKQLPSSWRHPDPERRSKSPAEAIIEIATNPREKEILEMAVRIMNFPSHMGLHPGGIVVSPPEKMTDHCPLFLSPKGFLATQFDYRDVETLGLIKMDVLGIRALTVIEIAIEEINRQDAGSKLQVEDIPFDDEATGDLIEKGATLGVFQYESTGSQRTLRQLKARDLWGLALANAFFKPGPATGGQAKNFIRRIRGEEDVSYMHPALEPILSKTAGVLVFQEDVLRICTEIGKLNWTEANSIRKGMSKFEGSRIREMRERFVTGATSDSQIAEEVAQTLWDQIEAFAGYGFNAGHALSYAIPSYQMAWLKTHYPAEFMLARLRAGGGYHTSSVNIAEARQLGILVYGPHANFSRSGFSLSVSWGEGRSMKYEVESDQPLQPSHFILYTGLGRVKDLRRSTIQAIIEARNERPFSDVDDFVRRVPCREKELQHLIKCGALDGLGASRNAMLGLKHTENQMSLFGAETAAVDAEPDTPEQNCAWEIELLGMPFSVRPQELLDEEGTVPIADLAQMAGRRVKTIGWKLPSYTGGKGFYISDGEGLILAWDKVNRPPRSWEPAVFVGEWKKDRYGGEWFQVG